MPSSHRRYRDWTHERIPRDAAQIGPDADTLIDIILRSRPHPEQGFRSAIGILGLVKRYARERVDAACARALLLNARSYKSVAAILHSGKDKAPAATADAPILFRTNLIIIDDWGPEPHRHHVDAAGPASAVRAVFGRTGPFGRGR